MNRAHQGQPPGPAGSGDQLQADELQRQAVDGQGVSVLREEVVAGRLEDVQAVGGALPARRRASASLCWKGTTSSCRLWIRASGGWSRRTW